MKLILKFAAYILLTGVLIHISCKKEYSCQNCKETNQPPIANAGLDQVITLLTDSISLDGSKSSDPDGKISEWLWTKISGPASFNINSTTTSVTFAKNLVKGIYQFELKVTDNGGMSAKDTIQIIVNNPIQANRPPVANAGADQVITLPNNSTTLDGSDSNDPDNNITGYLWTKISGPSIFNIANANVAQAQASNLVEGIYQFELKVSDSGGLLAKDTLSVNVVKNSLSGQEFIFDSLIWESGDFYGVGSEDIYVGTPARPDIFINSPPSNYSLFLPGEVYLKFDTASNWIQVKSVSLFDPNLGVQYVYDVISPFLYVHVYPLNYQLVGKKASIMVRFF